MRRYRKMADWFRLEELMQKSARQRDCGPAIAGTACDEFCSIWRQETRHRAARPRDSGFACGAADAAAWPGTHEPMWRTAMR